MTGGEAPALRIMHVTHRFKQNLALSDVSFTVDARSIHGFVGPNGAGKTTTLKLIATLLRPQFGRIEVFGENVATRTKHVRRRMGFMPDHFSMYRQMTVFEYLDFFAAAYGQPLAKRDRVIGDVLALTDMHGRRNDLIQGLSRGMQQRVSLARVLVHDPDLLLLDEPASGLDPRARIELMAILRELRSMGKTIFISSHILAELADLCDSVTIIDRGRVRYSGAMDQLLQHSGQTRCYELLLSQTIPDLEQRLSEAEGITAVTVSDGLPRYLVVFEVDKVAPGVLLRMIMDAGGDVVRFAEQRRHLNEAFMDLTSPGVPGGEEG